MERLDGLQRGKEPLADGLQLVVVQGEEVEVLQVLKCVHPQTVDLVGIEEEQLQGHQPVEQSLGNLSDLVAI